MITGITLIVLSILAVPSLILSRKPNAKELLDKLTPFQGWIGLVFCVWGIWNIINVILGLGYLTTHPLWWITWLAASVVMAVLGFLLGYGLIQKYALSKNEAAAKKGEQVRKKLAAIQGKLGIFGIIVGIWVIIFRLFFW